MCISRQNRDADEENGRVRTAGDGEGGTSSERSTGVYAQPWVQPTLGEAAGSTGSSVLCADPEQQDEGRGGSERERRPSAQRDSRRCTAESSTTV